MWIAREVTTDFFFISEQQVSDRFQWDQFTGLYERKELSDSSQQHSYGKVNNHH